MASLHSTFYSTLLMLSKSFKQELTSVYILPWIFMVNWNRLLLFVFPPFYAVNAFNRKLSRRFLIILSHLLLSNALLQAVQLSRSNNLWSFYSILLLLLSYFLKCKQRKKYSYLCVDKGEFPEGKTWSLFLLIACYLENPKVNCFVESWPIPVTLDSVEGWHNSVCFTSMKKDVINR